MQRLAAAFLLLAISLGCLHAPLRRYPYASVWRRIDDGWLSLETNAPDGEAAHAELRLLRDTLASAPWWPEGAAAAPVRVVRFEEADELHEYVPGRYEVLPALDPFGRAIIFTSAAVSPLRDPRLKHAIAHHVIDGAFPSLPAWLAEGLAVEAELIALPGDDSSPRAQADRVERLARDPALAMRTLLRADGTPAGPLGVGSMFADGSWCLFDHLRAGRSEQLAAYLQLLAQGEEADAAWEKAFADLTFQDAVVAASQGQPTAQSWPVGTGLSVDAPPAMPLEMGEVLALRAEAMQVGARAGGDLSGARAARLAAAALTEDPGNLRALGVLWRARGAEGLSQMVEKALLERPRDPRVWILLAQLPGATPVRREDALRVASSLAPRQGFPLAELALVRALAGRDGSHLGTSAAAVDRSPAVLELVSRALCIEGRTGEARQAADAALLRLHESPAWDLQQQLLQDLKTIDNGCPARESRATPEAVEWRPDTAPPAPDEQCLRLRPSAPSGVVLADYVVEAAGQVADTVLTDPAWGPAAEAVKKWLTGCHFAAGSAPVRVTQPFIFLGAQ